MTHNKCLNFRKEIYIKPINKDITPTTIFDMDVNTNSILI